MQTDATHADAARPRKTTPTWLILLVLFLASGILVAFYLRLVVYKSFKIPSGSMLPTMNVGETITMNAMSREPSYGDVIVFAFPEHPEQDFAKRVAALEGDVLEMRAGHPRINGWDVPSCLVGPFSYTEEDGASTRHEGDLYLEILGDAMYLVFFDRGFPARDVEGPFRAKPGEVWVLGDNRNNSHDSRMWFMGRGGGVPKANIHGRVNLPALPKLPESAASLAPKLEACVKGRPSAEKLRPPRPQL